MNELKVVYFFFILVASGYSEEKSSAITEGIELFNTAFNIWEEALFDSAYQIFENAGKQSFDKGKAEENTYLVLYWKAVIRFHQVLFYIDENENNRYKKQISVMLKDVAALLEESIDLHDGFCESYSLLATALGMKIADNPMSAVWSGPKVMQYQKRALELDPENPRTYYLIGSSYFHAPQILGGYAKGLRYFLKAEEYYEKEKKSFKKAMLPRWGYSSLLTFTAKTYLKMKNMKKAEYYLEKALLENPYDQLAQKEYFLLTRSEDSQKE